MSKLKWAALALAIMAAATACQTVKQMRNFANCAFRMQDMTRFNFVGVDISGKQSITDFGFADVATITRTLSGGGGLNFGFVANVEVKNPNAEPAAMTRLDWILEVDGKDLVNGALDKRVDVAGGGTALMPVTVNVDLAKLFADKRESALDFIFDTSRRKTDSNRIAFKVKPYINIAGFQLPYPGYITVKKDF